MKQNTFNLRLLSESGAVFFPRRNVILFTACATVAIGDQFAFFNIVKVVIGFI